MACAGMVVLLAVVTVVVKVMVYGDAFGGYQCRSHTITGQKWEDNTNTLTARVSTDIRNKITARAQNK